MLDTPPSPLHSITGISMDGINIDYTLLTMPCRFSAHLQVIEKRRIGTASPEMQNLNPSYEIGMTIFVNNMRVPIFLSTLSKYQ